MTVTKISPMSNVQQQSSKNKIWNAERVAECIRLTEEGRDTPGGTPFHEGDISYRAENVVYDYSEKEIREVARCAADVVYFANTYCVAMTDEGIQKITLRPYQIEVLRSFQDNRFNVFLASRQIGKSFLSQTIIEISNKSSEKSQFITFYEFYFAILKRFRKLSIHENLRFLLYKIQSKLTHGKIYKLEI
jgi:hypothetical protein